MNKGIILLVALFALIAVSNARPLMFFADQTDGVLGISKEWAGLAYAWTTSLKGQNLHRLRIFGVTHINETKTDAWINYKNGTIIEHLALAQNSSLQYYLGDFRVNSTVWSLLTTEQLWVTVASSSHKNGSVSGYFRCRPYQGVSYLSGDQVVSGTGAATGVIGLGWASIDVADIFALPADILDQATTIAASTSFSGRVIHDENGATAVTYHAPATSTETAPSLATATLYYTTNDGEFRGATVDNDFYSLTDGEAYFQVSGTSGDLRGIIYPLLTPTRRAIPYFSTTVNGNTVIPSGGYFTLRYANQEGSNNNQNSYVNLVATSSGGNFTYLGLFYFPSAVTKKNFDLVKALTLEINAQITGSGTWLFELFDSTSGEYIPIGTLTDANTWTAVQVQHWSFAVSDYADNRGQLVARLSVNSASAVSMQLDLFGIRSWTPNAFTNQNWKALTQAFDSQPAVFANKTVINA